MKEIVDQSNKVFQVGDFSSKEINWEEVEIKKNTESWSEELFANHDGKHNGIIGVPS